MLFSYVDNVYLSTYDNVRKAEVLFIYHKNPNTVAQIDWTKAPVIYRCFSPIRVPNFPNIGAAKKAAKFAIPNTNPY